MLISDKPRRPRHELDHYATPRAHVEQGLSLVTLAPRSILDPSAGAGIWGEVARQRWPRSTITGVELRPGQWHAAYNQWHTGDFRAAAGVLSRFDLICGNPPYSHAEEFISAALPLLSRAGTLLFLLRLQFLDSQRRAAGLFAQHPPARIVVCSRPRFYGDTSGAEGFAFWLWREGWQWQPSVEWLTKSGRLEPTESARRNATRAVRRREIEAAIRSAPELSDRRIAALVGVSGKTVAAVRRRLEASAEIPQSERRVGADGRARRHETRDRLMLIHREESEEADDDE